jgi:hypothetical protein
VRRTSRSFNLHAPVDTVLDRVVRELEGSDGETTRTGNLVRFTFRDEPPPPWWWSRDSDFLRHRDDGREFEVAAVETSVGLSHVTISGRIMKQEAAALETTLKDAFPTS